MPLFRIFNKSAPINQASKGVSLVEVVVAIGIIAVALFGILQTTTFLLVASDIAKQTNQATLLAQEAMEVVRNYRDGTNWIVDGLGTLTPGIPYHPEQIGGLPPAWTFVVGPETINGFTRQVTFVNVFRDTPGTDNIVTTGGALDPDTLKATVTIVWQERGNNHNFSVTAYFTNWDL